MYSTICFCGANDMLINFDNKFTLSQLHTECTSGNGQFQNPNIPTSDEPLQSILSINERVSCFSIVDKNKIPQSYSLRISSPRDVISSQSGVSLINISTDSSNYKNSLFQILGFTYEQLIPIWGKPQNQFNRGNYNQIGDTTYQYNNRTKPFTTQGYISSADQLSFSQMLSSDVVGSTYFPKVVPSGNLGVAKLGQASVNGSSDLLIAQSLPQKLAYAYLLIYSNIVESIFYGGSNGRQRLPCIGYINRSFETGNYFFGGGSQMYEVMTSRTLTDIKTEIRMPDGQLALVGYDNTAIYKLIQKGVNLVDLTEETQKPKKNNP